MTEHKIVNGQKIELTTEEIAIKEAKEQEWENNRENRAWKKLRDKRNLLLAETDWTANTDVTMSDAMRTYRQALRDLPSSTSNPDDVVFPEKPEV